MSNFCQNVNYLSIEITLFMIVKKQIVMFDGKKVLITGGTGSLGTALTKRLLDTDVDIIRIYSRDEWKQNIMRDQIPDKRLRFLIGDVRDKERLSRAMEDVNIVFHAAALKHVPITEYNPFEAVKTNVGGTQNLIDACLNNNVELVLGIGTDKAVSPINTYGATKLLMERLLITANYYKGYHKTKFVCVRYGNVLGSRGSLLPTFVDQINSRKEVTVTELSMTRFNITMKQALDLVLRAAKYGKGGEIFVPKLKAYTVENMKNAIIELMDEKVKIRKIPVRPGEKYHESLINKDDLRNTYETKQDYIIYNFEIRNIIPKVRVPYMKTKLKDAYSSDRVELLTKKELMGIIVREGLIKNHLKT